MDVGDGVLGALYIVHLSCPSALFLFLLGGGFYINLGIWEHGIPPSRPRSLLPPLLV